MIRAIVGAGGFAREVYSYLNDSTVPFFVEDKYWYRSMGSNIFPLSKFDPKTYMAVVAIANPSDRAAVVGRMPVETVYFTYVHSSVQIFDPYIKIGRGSIICPNVTLTTGISLGRHTHLNIGSTIGHDTSVGDFFTTAPGANVSGNCKIGSRVYIGTNASIREKLEIVDDVTVGLNAGVVKDISEPGIYVGTPAKRLK